LAFGSTIIIIILIYGLYGLRVAIIGSISFSLIIQFNLQDTGRNITFFVLKKSNTIFTIYVSVFFQHRLQMNNVKDITLVPIHKLPIYNNHLKCCTNEYDDYNNTTEICILSAAVVELMIL